MNKGAVYIVSDGTGETASLMTKAALVQYSGYDVNLIRCKNVRSETQIEAILSEAKNNNGFVVFTIVSPELQAKTHLMADQYKVQHVDLLGPLLVGLDSYFGVKTSARTAGILRTVNESYFKRIAAIEFTVKHDDGKELRDLDASDIVLVGISRTSKTPLSIFLSHKGWKVSNIPLVLNVPVPEEVFKIDQKKVVGLTINPNKLSKIRENRLEKLGTSSTEYASLTHIAEEIEYAHSIFSKNKKWPVFDVTEKALEETATDIIRLVSKRFGVKTEEFF